MIQSFIKFHTIHFFGLWIFILMESCTNTISLNIDKDNWVADHDGCSGYRMKVYEEIIHDKGIILGLSTSEIIELLGKPNKNELYKRNQKFFVYQISPGKSCEAHDYSSDIFLIFRFNAMGLANEIYLNEEASPTE